ncbi:MAG: phenylacetate--CoA ligase family protein, partial [Solirubrobacterales bacterium]
TEMMARYDDLVTDRGLRRGELLEWVGGLDRDRVYRGAYRAMTTSGSSGSKGLFAYDAEGWRTIAAQFIRVNETIGAKPRLPRRFRITAVAGVSANHMSRQASASVDVGVNLLMMLDATAPVAELVARLNEVRPDGLFGYPSVITRLAEEQLAGRLRVAPSVMLTASELRPTEATARIVEAFGVHPYDLYATTEGLWGWECERHEGIHLREDVTIVENVDAEGRPVAAGEPGAKLLVTNLYNRVQPIIRLAVADAVTIDPEPCPCGRTLIRMSSVEGRSDDVLELPGVDGRPVSVHPLRFAVIAADREVREFQVVREEETGIRILVVAANGAGPGLGERVRAAVAERLGELGATEVRICVERREALERTGGGKLQIVVDRSGVAPR